MRLDRVRQAQDVDAEVEIVPLPQGRDISPPANLARSLELGGVDWAR
jgi:hypothetical protein